MPAVIFALLLWVLIPLAALAQSDTAGSARCGAPEARGDAWDVAAPDTVGLDPTTLCGIAARFQDHPEADLNAVLVARHGKLVYEHYFSGTDEHLGRPLGSVTFDANTKHDLRSITKSVTALVLGIAIGKGQLLNGQADAVDQPIMPLLPDYADLRTPEKDKITLRDLLTMSPGFVWDEDIPYANPANSEIQMDYAPDPVRYVLSRPMATAPGAVFNYTGGSATIIARLLHDATGQSLDALARAWLFGPLGITDVDWSPIASGEPAAASGLRLRPRDTLKIGQLVLDHGAWQGQPIVPADWIAAATAPHITGPDLWFYGYQFWLGRSFWNGRQVNWVCGVGYGGQRLIIVPELDVVVLVHAGLYGRPNQGAAPLIILNRFVLASVRN